MKSLVFYHVTLSIYFAENINQQKIMIDIQQLTSLISAFRVETWCVGLQLLAIPELLCTDDPLAASTCENKYNVLHFY